MRFHSSFIPLNDDAVSISPAKTNVAGAEKKDSLQCDLFTRIASDFPDDVGCWSVYFMNYVILQEGESMFLGPNVPHAYIFGGTFSLSYA